MRPLTPIACSRSSRRGSGTVLLDPRDLLLQSERTQGFAADVVYVKGEVFAHVGRNQHLKDLNWWSVSDLQTPPLDSFLLEDTKRSAISIEELGS